MNVMKAERERQWDFDLPVVRETGKQLRAVVLAEKFVTREMPEFLETLSYEARS